MAHNHYASTDFDPSCDLCQMAAAMRPLEDDQPEPATVLDLTSEPCTFCGAKAGEACTSINVVLRPGQVHNARRDAGIEACDECHHSGTTSHLWAPAVEAEGHAEAARFVYEHSTCWAENICISCDPLAYSQAVASILNRLS